jgi:hypothetical protein
MSGRSTVLASLSREGVLTRTDCSVIPVPQGTTF